MEIWSTNIKDVSNGFSNQLEIFFNLRLFWIEKNTNSVMKILIKKN